MGDDGTSLVRARRPGTTQKHQDYIDCLNARVSRSDSVDSNTRLSGVVIAGPITCTGRRAVPVTPRALLQLLLRTKRASYLAPVS